MTEIINTPKRRGRKTLFTSPRDQLSIRVSTEVHEKLRALCALRGMKKTEAVNSIIDEAYELSTLPVDVNTLNSENEV